MVRAQTCTVLVCALMAMVCVDLAGAAGEGPIISFDQVEFSVDARFKPRSVSRTESEPIQVSLNGDIGTVEKAHPPALNELVLEADKNLRVNAEGIPTCSGARRQLRLDTEAMEAACGPAIIGEGRTTVEVQFPEQPPVTVTSKLLLINGGTRGATTTWYVHAYFDAPIAAEVLATVEINKHRNGRFGTVAVATIPKIAGGAGAVRSFQLTVHKNVRDAAGNLYHPITGRCADGKLQIHVDMKFADGDFGPAEIARACTQKS